MKKLGFFLALSAIALAALPTLAQQTPGPGGANPMYDYGHGHMWGGHWGWHSGMIFGPFVMLLAIIGLVALIVWLVRHFSHESSRHWHGHGACPRCGYGRARLALDILEERFAKGEIGKEEFEEKRRVLGR
jgi:putative membrane protein